MTITPRRFPAWTDGTGTISSGFCDGPSAERAIAGELRKRGPEYVDLWNTADDVNRSLAFRVAAIIKAQQKYMPNDHFIPEDACQVLFVCGDGTTTPADIAEHIERELNVTFNEVVWDECQRGGFADFIRELGKLVNSATLQSLNTL